MTEPKKNKDLAALFPECRVAVEAWLKQARATFPQFNINVSETRRTKERQEWLYAQGRTRPGPVVTYTLDSRHRAGLAVDLVVTRKLTPFKAEWDWRVWRAIYKAVPPEKYGLRPLDFEMVHLELINSDAILARRPAGLVIT
ncbi:M15 family metallopeptidase [Deinococcus peraridilitoris]|uniref:D-alanyl-D-alanine carboxypeptidase n=1 Tax=Deinococcus peraridilitoris (strain DSM 19664 / LMG 22246 / CIP 109416 / KR-200) TaxID=937777 RepID=L0A3K4_DEIPD|nr:M15 family metallopeptidase [Deinococcus peraridilitoris]AFZ67585.1 D-alanyl-D-alanine carboxypeptidase [Deinococcus peraridilitoris DSM 19664]